MNFSMLECFEYLRSNFWDQIRSYQGMSRWSHLVIASFTICSSTALWWSWAFHIRWMLTNVFWFKQINAHVYTLGRYYWQRSCPKFSFLSLSLFDKSPKVGFKGRMLVFLDVTRIFWWKCFTLGWYLWCMHLFLLYCFCLLCVCFCLKCFEKSSKVGFKEKMQVFWERVAVVVKQEDYVCTDDDDDESIMMNLQRRQW